MLPFPWLVALSGLSGCWTPAPAPPAPVDAAADGAPNAVRTNLPDLVFITLDTTRADHLGLYGYPRVTSPALDALGTESLVFERLIVPMATTLPTHTSLFLSTWPEEHGVLANVQHGGRRFVASDALVPFATWAASLGYQTAGFTSAMPLGATTGIQTGFQTFSAPRGERPGSQTVDEALAWLGEASEAPLLLWVHLYDPHNPYHPNPVHQAAMRATSEEIEPWLEARKFARETRRPNREVVRLHPTIHDYDAEIRTMDDAVLRLVDALRARPRWPTTAVVVMGDHGEGLNQHGEPGHGLVWNEQLHAPLLLRVSGLAAGRNATLLSAADVIPTLLGQLELPREEAYLTQASGRDVLAPGFVERPVLSQASERQVGLGKERVFALTAADHKCVTTETDHLVLYRTTTDPFELTPVDDAAAAQACREQLLAVLGAQRARGVALGAGRTVKAPADELEMLKALGYHEPDE